MKPGPLQSLAALALGLALCMPASATVFNLQAVIDGAQANAGLGTGSLGTGSATMTLDDTTNQFSWNITWSGLTGVETVAHFHGPAPAGVNAGVQVPILPFPPMSPAIGNAMLTGPQASDLLAGLWYVNIHTRAFAGGEIRGQVTRVPEPMTTSLLALGLLGAGYARRRRAH